MSRAQWLYLALTAVVCVPSMLGWTEPRLALGDREFELWRGLATAAVPGRWLHTILFTLLGLQWLRVVRSQTAIHAATVPAIWTLYFLTIPWMSPDVAFYAAKGWLQVSYHLDPYVATIATTGRGLVDPMLAGVPVGLHRLPGNYGILFQALSAGVAAVSGGDPRIALLLFKVVMTAGLYGCARMLESIARPIDGSADRVRRLLSLNPLILFNFVAAAHNDVLMMCCVLGAVWAAERFRWVLAGVAMGVGISFKIAPIFVLPAFAVLLWRSSAHGPRVRNFVLALIGLAATVGLTVLASPAAARFLYTVAANRFGGSRSSILLILSPAFAQLEQAYGLSALVFLRGMFVLLSGIVLLELARAKRDELSWRFLIAAFEILVLSLYLVLNNLTEWYVLWPICFGVAVATSATDRWLYIVSIAYMPLAIWHIVGPTVVTISAQLGIVVMMTAALIVYFGTKTATSNLRSA